MSFGTHLRTLREAAGLSRADLARRAGVPASTLRNWEGDRGGRCLLPSLGAGRINPSLLTVAAKPLLRGGPGRPAPTGW
jgi:transcriptional regulator with XRE-family HTH domain